MESSKQFKTLADFGMLVCSGTLNEQMMKNSAKDYLII
jgi:hypothetical protein